MLRTKTDASNASCHQGWIIFTSVLLLWIFLVVSYLLIFRIFAHGPPRWLLLLSLSSPHMRGDAHSLLFANTHGRGFTLISSVAHLGAAYPPSSHRTLALSTGPATCPVAGGLWSCGLGCRGYFFPIPTSESSDCQRLFVLLLCHLWNGRTVVFVTISVEQVKVYMNSTGLLLPCGLLDSDLSCDVLFHSWTCWDQGSLGVGEKSAEGRQRAWCHRDRGGSQHPPASLLWRSEVDVAYWPSLSSMSSFLMQLGQIPSNTAMPFIKALTFSSTALFAIKNMCL